jgi:hypothetical protein
MNFEFSAELWLYQGDGAWVFVTLPADISEDIKLFASGLPRKGFGSVKVTAEVSGVKWDTSIFPDTRLRAYLLPIKKTVRNKASISAGDKCIFKIQIDDLS